MKEQYVFDCPITKYAIEYIVDIDTKSAMLNTIICDYVNIKAFLALLRTSIDKLVNLNIEIIYQTVAHEEWENYLKNKTSWKIKKKDIEDVNQEIYELECSIKDFLENYGIGIGIVEL